MSLEKEKLEGLVIITKKRILRGKLTCHVTRFKNWFKLADCSPIREILLGGKLHLIGTYYGVRGKQ